MLRSIEQEIQVTFRYAVHFTTGVFDGDNPSLRDVIRSGTDSPRKVLFVVDDGVREHHPGLLGAIDAYCRRNADVLTPVGMPLIVPGGERVKNDPRHVDAILQAVHEGGICRHSYIVAVGGGAVIDMAGYAAATAHRGVRLIRIPTTVLSQNDGAVGVKNSVNAFHKKNFLGAFAPPVAVINDARFLTTLSERDWRSGISEAVKVALLKDPGFFGFLEQEASALRGRDMIAMQRLIHRCAELHLQHIAGSGDPFELGSSRPLDFGHWAAHKLEQLTDYGLRHGEAVAIGIALDATYSFLRGYLPETDWRRVLNVLADVGFALYTPEMGQYLDRPEHPRSVLRGLTEFREHLGGELTIMLLRGIGDGFEVHEIDGPTAAASIVLLGNFQKALDSGASFPDAVRLAAESRLSEVRNAA